ncbi:MAG: hypothetical protein QOG53_888 [Frankiales bacterium]|nr:hypothetical protein [Frankiales bacterium]
MRLEGSLDAFSLPDIFQLLSFTKKTGGLHLRRDDLHGVVYVTTGSLTGGSSNVGRQALARRLIGAGIVDDDVLRGAVDAVLDSTDLGVARALQQAGTLDDSLLHETASEHVIDTVFDLLRWPEGDFEFVIDESNPDDVGVAVTVENAVEEARRRLDGWSQVSTTIPSPEAVLAVALAPVEDPTFSRDEWALLALVDGRRPVADIVGATGRGEYAVVSALASLVDRGLLVVTTDGEPPAVQQLLRRVSALAGVETGQAPVLDDPVGAEISANERESTASTVAEAFAATTPVQREPEPAEEKSRSSRRQAEATTEVIVDASIETLAGDLDTEEIIPARAEPMIPRRRPEHPDDDLATAGALIRNQIDGTAAIADPPMDPLSETALDASSGSGLIERDPSVNKSLLLRLIAGVRGL